MKLVHKVWLGIGIALLTTLLSVAWFGYQFTQRNIEASLLTEGRTLSSVIMAVRRTYQQQFLASGIPLDEHTVGFLPAHAMPRIAQQFQAFDHRGVRFNNVSDRARNPANQADPVEMAAIRHFRDHPKDKERLVPFRDANGQDYFHYSTPIWVEAYCLTCHGDPKDAPPAIQARYQTAWGYKLGELRGILSVKMPASDTRDRILGLWWREQGIHFAAALLSLLTGGLLVHFLVVRKLTAFRAGARRLAAGDYAWRFQERGEDETADLARSLNEMARTIQDSQHGMRLAASVFSHALDGIIITDDKGVIIDANPAFSRITGYSREEAVGRTPALLASGRHDASFYASMWRAIQEQGVWSGEIWNRRKNGEVYPERLSITAVLDAQSRLTHFVGVFSDISVIKHQEAQLVHLAQHDPLTGLPNRALLADRIRQAIHAARRNGSLLAVCYLDLDGFKPVNDQHGHEVGDRLLVEMSRRMQAALRADDTVARLGGDEFVFLLQGLRSSAECEASLGRLLASIAQPVMLIDPPISLSASIGVSLYPSDDQNPDALLRQADQAMYAAKQAGRNRYVFYDLEGDRQVRSHRESRERIRQALTQGEFVLHYQPEINMRTGALVGAEALVRWQHPEHGLLLPRDFLPVIENSALDDALGEWVLDQALKQLADWHARGLDITVSVNVSAHHLQHTDFAGRLQARLSQYPDLAKGSLVLEILENAALEDLARVSDVIRTCQKLGSHFALDDFGTGYSSLTHLKRLPVQSLKIDQSFIHDMLRDPEDLAIVEGVIALAEAFGREVIAEGVDSLEAGLLLMQLGCQVAQGYIISRPLPGEEMFVWADKWQAPDAWSEENFRYWRKEDFALLLAQYHHREWIDNLADRIEGAEAVGPLMLDSESCRFGRWYQGSGRIRYGHLEEFAALDASHVHAHELGAELLALLRDNRAAEARARLPELFSARDQLLDRLHQLQSRVLTDQGNPAPG